jgi:uncharacterized damage-inducible protein DinB
MIHQTPWIERKFEFNFPVGLFPVIIERLRGTLPRIESIVNNKTEEVLNRKFDESWSVKEQIGHLYDLEDLWHGRIEDFLSGKQTLRTADMSNTKTHNADNNKKNIEELLHQFSSARNKLIEKVQHMDETTASITALHPRLQIPMRLIDALFFVAEHDDHHLAKIRSLVETD